LTDEQRAACIESHVRSSRNFRIVGKAIISKSIRHHEQLTSRDGVCAERRFPRRLASLQAMRGLEPLAVPVHQAHKGDGHPENTGGKTGEAIEPLFFRRIEDS
jgi:hypothetical protein